MLKALALGAMTLSLAFSGRQSAPQIIEMTDNMVYVPREMTVLVGEVVVWKNVSTMSHSVNTVADHCRTDEGKRWVGKPSGAPNFFSDEIKPGDSYRVRFEIPGVYQYLCTYHEDGMMRGTIIVEGSR